MGVSSPDSTAPFLAGELDATAEGEDASREGLRTVEGVMRIACFFGMTAVLALVASVIITTGLRHVKTGQFGVSNRIMEGAVNADIVITGSSRAVSHYDSRLIQAATGHRTFNLGRNGSQTDMQIAVLKAYLRHNRKPTILMHNLDAFAFVATREVYNPVQYVPYLYDEELYQALRRINPSIWKSRYLPLYGYVVDEMSFAWLTGLGGFFGWSPRETFFEGYNPRPGTWTQDFQQFKAANPGGVAWPVESEAVALVEGLINVCQQNGIRLIFVYSPEYKLMQQLTKNRADIFGRFYNLAERRHVPFWDYSEWRYAANTDYFTNSQHLNSRGAEVFSADVAKRVIEYLATRSGGDRRIDTPSEFDFWQY